MCFPQCLVNERISCLNTQMFFVWQALHERDFDAIHLENLLVCAIYLGHRRDL